MVLSNEKIKAYFLITRPINLALVLLTLLLFRYFYLIPELTPYKISVLPNWQYTTACISVLFTMASGNVINDIFDYLADLINKPTKVYVERLISKKSAFIYYFILLFIALSLSTLISSKFLFIVSTTNALLFIYSKYLKHIAFIGNLIIASLSAIIPLLAIWLDVQYIFSNINDSNIFYLYRFALVFSLFSFFGTLGREIIKDIEDYGGDKSILSKSLPNIIGIKS